MRCRRHTKWGWFDKRFGAWRCEACGHRIMNASGQPVQPTRSLPPRLWWQELAGRRWARRMDRS